MSLEPPVSLHVPPAQRHRFVATCMGLWIGAAGFWWLSASFRHWAIVMEWVFAGGLMLLVMIVQGLLERRLRRKWLPFQGQTLWCLRASLLTPVLAVFVVWAIKPIRPMIPGSYRSVSHGDLDVMTVRGSRFASISFSEQMRSLPTFTFHLPDLYEADELRFYSKFSRDQPGWIIRAGQRTIQKVNGSETQPMSGVGLLRVLEEISGQKVPASDEATIILILEARSKEWLSGKAFDPKLLPRPPRAPLVIGSAWWIEDREPRWLAYVLGGVVLVFVALAISLTAKATMGEGN